MTAMRGLCRLLLPIASIAVFAAVVGLAVVASARSGTLGFDFLSYDSAVRRFLAGGPLYDQSYVVTGGFGLFYYPPPFLVLALPFAVIDPNVAAWLWSAVLVATFVTGVVVIPVRPSVRWAIILLAGFDWPLVYAIKLGQVGPILFLLFAIGWRWMERPWVLGASAAVGTLIKIQPVFVLAWAVATRRWRAVAIGVGVVGIVALATTLITGPAAWVDQATLLARLSQPITTPHNVTPGRVAFDLGLSEGWAYAIQLANWIVVAMVVVAATARCSSVASYLAVVIASQLVSPILWDHYAMVLLLPVAWLLDRGRHWAVVIPLATAVPFVGYIPPIVYPIVIWVALVAVVVEGWNRGPAASSGPTPSRPAPA